LTVSSLLGFSTQAPPEASAQTPGWPQIGLFRVTDGLVRPTEITNAGDGSGRLFVAEQPGRIRIIQNSKLRDEPFLDITSKVGDGGIGGEAGLLGVAFPPGYSTKHYFYVVYTPKSLDHTVLARYSLTSDPNQADANSEEQILEIQQPLGNHFGGHIAFGPNDGYLYMSSGDGDGEGAPDDTAQVKDNLLGKLLRIDVECCVNKSPTYQSPSSNPFFSTEGYRPEIYALGFRNPWRFSFDRVTGDLFIGDVGQSTWEEVNYLPASSGGGQNYGWRIKEGDKCYEDAPCDGTGLTDPAVIFDHDNACAIAGGYVYHGSAIPSLDGIYVFGDFCTGRIWGLRKASCQWDTASLLDSGALITTFGEDESGELYVSSYQEGAIYQVIAQQSIFSAPSRAPAATSRVFIPSATTPPKAPPCVPTNTVQAPT
jgi:glucose/arabinose dehydrogenase